MGLGPEYPHLGLEFPCSGPAYFVLGRKLWPVVGRAGVSVSVYRVTVVGNATKPHQVLFKLKTAPAQAPLEWTDLDPNVAKDKQSH